METTSEPGMIQLSKEAADCLLEHGKENWIKPRDLHVVAKGKGILDTFWLVSVDYEECTRRSEDPYAYSKTVDTSPLRSAPLTSDEKLIEWNVKMLHGLVKKIVAFRKKVRGNSYRGRSLSRAPFELSTGHTYLEELDEIIELPQHEIDATDVDEDDVVIPAVVLDQLRLLVSEIASMYCRNPFHNFEVSPVFSVHLLPSTTPTPVYEYI